MYNMSNNIINGVIYYKQEEKYEGDVTKYCGLTGGEIDSNVFFLRGYDIKDVTIDDINNHLILSRVNGDKIVIENIKSSINKKETYYDPQNGVLHLSIGGVEHLIEGFYYEEKDIQISTDSTLCGSGKNDSPLKINKTIALNKFICANKLVDMTKGEQLPLTEIPGTYLLTKEYVSPYGLLYNINGVKEIEEKLISENSEWRVPTDEEWAEMLNAVEINNVDRTHISTSMGELGKYAGSILRENVETWNTSSNVGNISDFMNYFTGFKVYPSGKKTTGGDNSFGMNTFFWTSSKFNNSSFMTRSISCDKNGVDRIAVNDEVFISLRLIKNNSSSINAVEYINGIPVETILMPYVKMDANGHIIEEGNRVWTSHNVSIPLTLIGNYMECEGGVDTHFYINHWNGKTWDKYRLSENTRIVLNTGIDNSSNKEWIIEGDNIVRCDSEVFKKISSIEQSINTKLEEELQIVNNSLEALNNELTTSIDDIESDITVLNKDVQSINNTLDVINNKTIVEINSNISSLSDRITILGNETQSSLSEIVKQIANIENTIKNITNSINSLNKNMEKVVTIDNVSEYAVTSISSESNDIQISNKKPGHTPVNTGDVVLTLDWLYNISEGDAQNVNNN